MAARYGQRPSALLDIADPVVALDFDITVCWLALHQATPADDADEYDLTPQLCEVVNRR